jgi:hypothetical protein
LVYSKVVFGDVGWSRASALFLGKSFVMGESLLNRIIEDFVVAVHRKRLDADEVLETAEHIYALATRLDWNDGLEPDIERLKRPLAAGWERRFWDASTKARRFVGSGDLVIAACAIRGVVREIAVSSNWRPLAFFGYDDIIDLEVIEKNFLDRSRLTERCPHVDGERVDEALGYARRLHDRLGE